MLSPHSGQNFAAEGSSVAHFGQLTVGGGNDAPHSEQNFTPSMISDWQLGQFISSLPLFYWLGSRIHYT
jgi:hypothetical protein